MPANSVSSILEHMFDPSDAHPPTLEALQLALHELAGVDGAGIDQAGLIEHLSALEALKSAVAAAQARVTVTLANARSASEAARGLPARKRCQGLAAEIALATRQSPNRGARNLGFARALVQEMPETLAALTCGTISEWRATIVVRETAILAREHRTQVDTELGPRLPLLGDRAAGAEARRIGYRLDPGSALRRVRGAHSDRHVSLRPAPDTMSCLTGFLPVAQGVACYAALKRQADSLRGQGDARSRGQIMADTLVERLTGQRTAEGVSVEVHLVMTDEALFNDDDAPTHLTGFGPIPASLARQVVRAADRVWLRRLFARPTDGSLVAMDSRGRAFEGELRQFLIVRDQICRTPWCDAPVKHVDHITRAADGGPTSAENGQGLCETCNYTKEAPGWKALRIRGGPHRVQVLTPTGHSYISQAPDPPVPEGSFRKLKELVTAEASSLDPYGTSIEMLARSVPGVADIDAQKSVVRIQGCRPMGRSRLGISGSSPAVKSLP